MKKKIIAILCALVLIGAGSSGASVGTPNVTTSSWLNVPVTCLDTVAGVQRLADSAHLHVYFGNADSSCYDARITTIPGSWIDRVVYAGASSYFFKDQIADIADSGAGFYSGVISLFTQGYPTDNYFSFQLVDYDFNNLGKAAEPYINRKNLYVVPNGDAVNEGLATTWATACSIGTVLERATGADEYYIYVAPGTYRDVDIQDDVGNTHWIGAGVGQTKLWGKQDIVGGLGAEYIFRFVTTTDSSAIEMTGFEFHGYEAVGGVEDSATLRAIQVNEPTTGFYIHDNHFYNFQETIYLCGATYRGRIERNWIAKPLLYGMEIAGGYGHWIVDNVIDSVSDGRYGIYSTASQGNIVYSGNTINAKGGRAFYAGSGAKRNIFVNNYARALADSAFVDVDGANIFIANHRRSQVSDPQTIEEDIFYAPRSANNDSGWTATRAEYLDDIDAVAIFMGAKADGYYQIFYPADGTAGKDSVRIFNSSDACKGTILFHHSNTSSVIDSVTYEKY